ncbi:MAG TPA: glycosyltransferase family 2 protein [Chitinophagales bacterium]|nr:glycosyltransferase family 2 protein [Chitinophagales bacterium]
MQISVIVPLLNEEESLPELAQWIARVMETHAYSWEVIFVDDGSRDKSWEVVQELHRKQPAYKGIKFRRNYGKSAALNEGFAMASGDVVITMDADLQDSPDEIPELYDMIVRDGLDMVSGWKKRRHDPIGKTIPSKFFNWITARITGIKLHDFNCGLKAYRRDVVKSIEVYGEMHRYIPQIAKTAGFYKIGEKVVEHRARKFGYSKFGWERFMKGFLDLTSIMFVSKFGKKPMHLFGTLGFLSFLTGGVITVWLIIEKIIKLNAGEKYRQITDQPLFYIALVAMIVGVQLFVAGFLGELISRNSPDRNAYQIDQRLGDA